MLFYITGGVPQVVPGTACVEANWTACIEVYCSSVVYFFLGALAHVSSLPECTNMHSSGPGSSFTSGSLAKGRHAGDGTWLGWGIVAR
jgi:hypothetical protein